MITYDVHGGFYDHVAPPAAVDDDHEFQRLGVRVPALLVSSLVAPASTSSELLGPDFHFDHTSIIKTIFTRFCNAGGQIPALTARVAAAQHLGHLLTDAEPRTAVPDHGAVTNTLTKWRASWNEAPSATPTGGTKPGRLTDFRTGFYDMARLLPRAGLPGGHP